MPETPSPSDRDGGDRESAPLSRREMRERAQPAGDAARERQPVAVGASAAAGAGAEASAPATSPASLEDLFSAPAHVPVGGKERRRRRRRGGIIALAVVLAVLGGIAATGLWVWNTYEPQIRAVLGWEEPRDFEPGEATGELYFTITDGENPSDISANLFDEGVIKTPSAFYDHLISTGQNPPFYPGSYPLQERMTSAAVLEVLADPENIAQSTLAIPEGWTVGQIAPALSTALSVPQEDVDAALANPSDYGVEADTLEGWLFPATYEFAPETSAADAVQQLVDRMRQALSDAGAEPGDEERVLTVASIIQREVRTNEDMEMVARVVYNRLDPSNTETYGLLQMDSTAQYGYGQIHDGSVSSSAAALEDDNPWNTYVHAGLPVGPIANPGDDAIRATLNPADGPWLYFVTVNLDTGETWFSETYAEHERGVAEWDSWCRANPDGGC